jgi:threonine dehydrogenase-like Zn-dependent dehydrogenase
MTTGTPYAVTITAPEQAELLPIEPDVSPLAPHEVAGRTLVTLISVGTELSGAYRRGSFPRTLGYAAVFEIESASPEVADLAIGHRVFCMGPHRSFQRCAAADVLRLPQHLSPEVAVFARMMGVSMSTLATTTVRPPEKVLVTGLGLVGHLAAKIFSVCGYQVTGCDPWAVRRDLALQNGIPTVLPAVPLEDPCYDAQVGLVLECSSHEQAALDACRLVRKGGEVVLVGTPWQKNTDLSAHQLLHAVFHNYVLLRSGWEWQIPLHPTEFLGNSLFGNMASAIQWLAEGRIKVDSLYDVAPPSDAQRVYQDFHHRRAKTLTTLFDWRTSA